MRSIQPQIQIWAQQSAWGLLRTRLIFSVGDCYPAQDLNYELLNDNLLVPTFYKVSVRLIYLNFKYSNQNTTSARRIVLLLNKPDMIKQNEKMSLEHFEHCTFNWSHIGLYRDFSAPVFKSLNPICSPFSRKKRILKTLANSQR